MLRNKLIESACIQAERLYNLYQIEVCSSEYSDKQDDYINKISNLYRSVLVELNNMGIGGVLINGTFRYTNGE